MLNLPLLSLLSILLLVPGAQGKEAPPNPIKILFLGDSLTEGYGIPKTQAFPPRAIERLNSRLAEKKKSTRIEGIYAGSSGSTTASGPSRLKWYLKASPQILFLALGANDGLRGVSIAETEKNLEETLRIGKEAGLTVVLAGMKLPPNYGVKNARQFEVIFQRLSKKHGTVFVPFLLEGVAAEKSLNIEDGIHPNEKGHEKIADLVLPSLEKAVEAVEAKEGK